MTGRPSPFDTAPRRAGRWRAGVVALAFVASDARPSAAQPPTPAVPIAPLTVTELLAAVDRAFPLIAQARADVDAARGDRQSADDPARSTPR